MSLILVEGFDHYTTATAGGKVQLDGNSEINLSAGRFQGGGALITANASVSTENYLSLGANFSEVIVGFALYFDNTGTEIPAYTEVLAFVANTGSVQCMLQLGTGNTLYFTRGSSTVIANGSTPLVQGTWNYIEVRVVISDTVGEVEVKLNGVEEMNETAVDTKNTSVSSVNQVYFGSCRWQDSGRIDDVYAVSTAGSVNNDFLGDCRVDTLTVTGNGTTNQWDALVGPSNYQDVDDATPDDDTTYISTAVDGEIDLFDIENMSQASDVFGVQVVARAEKPDAGDAFLRLGVRSGGKNYFGPDQGLAVGYTHLKQIFETDPHTKGLWTRTLVNLLEIGVKRREFETTTTPPTSAPPATTAAPGTTMPPTTPAPTTPAPTTAV